MHDQYKTEAEAQLTKNEVGQIKVDCQYSFALVRARQLSFVLVCARRHIFTHLCSPAPVCAHSYLPSPACAQIPALVPVGKPSMGAGTGLRLSYLTQM